MEHHQTVERPQKSTQVGKQLFGVLLPIFLTSLKLKIGRNTPNSGLPTWGALSSKSASKFPISINFTNPLRKGFLSPKYP